MNNLHPFLSSFPVALVLIAALLEVSHLIYPKLALYRAASVNLVLAFVFTLLAFFSGYQAKEKANQTFTVAEDLIMTHHYWGRALIFILLPCIIFNFYWHSKRVAAAGLLYILSLLVACLVVLYAGYLGGELVFSHGAGVAASVAK